MKQFVAWARISSQCQKNEGGISQEEFAAKRAQMQDRQSAIRL